MGISDKYINLANNVAEVINCILRYDTCIGVCIILLEDDVSLC